MNILVSTRCGVSPTYQLNFQTGAALSNAEFFHFLAREGRLFEEIHLVSHCSTGAEASLAQNAARARFRVVDAIDFPRVAAG